MTNSSNHTGSEKSENVKKMLKACENFPPDILGDEHALEKQRSIFNSNADSIGSIPSPSTLKGSIKTTFKKILGDHPELFLDKLGERLAYERSGVRLYEAAIAKALGLKETKNTLLRLQHIRNEEAEHMDIIKNALVELGADPTAMTPCADLAGVMGQGFIQVISDPRTTLAQSLNTLLNVELIDNAAWELLIELAHKSDQAHLVKKFEHALEQEDEHVITIKSLLKSHLDLEETTKPAKQKEDYYVQKNENGGWDVKREHATRVSCHFSTKSEAITAGRKISKKSGVKLYVHPTDKNKKH